jgi:inosine-uridine nucleoside N-ribohydrolase
MGQTVGDFAGFWNQPPNARVVTSNDPGECFDLLVRRLGGLAAEKG